MSELNILNPSVSDALNPQFGLTEAHPEMFSRFRARVGPLYSRRLTARGRIWNLQWLKRSRATRDKLQQWAAQYEQGFFTIADYERTPYYSGNFSGPLTFSAVGYEQWNVQAEFEEGVGLPLYQYPSDFARDGIFIEERDDFGNNLVKLKTPGAWSYEGAGRHGEYGYQTATPGETAEWEYFGYGCTVWSLKANSLGMMDVYFDGVFAQTVDLYSAEWLPPAAVFQHWSGVPLGMHRVMLRCTGNKNAASSGVAIEADAIQVMR
jgi:hypothetical protein